MLKKIVPSGTYVISKRKEEILESYLGTCVGLTVCDQAAGLGGLLHILLPEPTGSGSHTRPETYASTGVPAFIQELCDAGGRVSRMNACIAGGALVGPLSQEDFSLDIGGRTTDIVQTLMRQQGIHIDQVETGGYLGCKLSIDLRSLKTTTEPLCPLSDSAEGDLRKPTAEEIDQAICNVRPIPQIALKIIRMIRNDDYDMDDIAAEVGQDQVISAKLINLCNRAMIGLRGGVDSIERALVALGEKRLLQLVITASMESIFNESSIGYSLCKGGIFQHALGTAMVAHELSVYTGRCPSDIAYTAGLLHDIGKIPLDQYVAPVSSFFYRTAHEDGIELCQLEKEKFGISHTEAGGILGERWLLPNKLVDVIRYHHQPEAAGVDIELITLVYLADLLTSRFQVGHELECLNTDQLARRLRRVGLGPEQFPIIIDRMPKIALETSLTGI